MSDANPGPGRPPRVSPETLARGELFAAMLRCGAKVEGIAAEYGISRTQVYDTVRKYQGFRVVEGGPEAAGAGANAEAPKSKLRLLSAATVSHRAMQATINVQMIRLLPPHQRYLWLKAVSDIRGYGAGGVDLSIGQRGDLFQSREEVLAETGCSTADLDALFQRGLLLELPESGIAMPLGFGLRPKVHQAKRAEQAGGAAQPFIIHGIDGGLNESGNMRINPDSESGKMGINPDSDGAINPDSVEVALAASLAAAAAAKRLESLDLSSSSSPDDCRAGESGKIRIKPDSESGFIPASESGFIPPTGPPPDTPPDLAGDPKAIARHLMVHAGLPDRSPNRDETEFAREWLAGGLPVATMEEVITEVLGRPDCLPKRPLKYFRGAMADEIARRAAAEARPPSAARPPPAAQPPPKPLSPAEAALEALIQRCANARASCATDTGAPFPPRREQIAENPQLCSAWMDDWEGWQAGGRRGDRPPDYVKFLASHAP